MDAAAELAQPGKENEKLRTDNVDPGRQLERLGVDCDDLKRQRDWLRRQLFGGKSGMRVEIPPEQTAFRDRPGLEHPEKPEEPEFEFAERKKKRGKKNFEGAADESGLRFGPDDPAGTIRLDNPEAEAIPESERCNSAKGRSGKGSRRAPGSSSSGEAMRFRSRTPSGSGATATARIRAARRRVRSWRL